MSLTDKSKPFSWIFQFQAAGVQGEGRGLTITFCTPPLRNLVRKILWRRQTARQKFYSETSCFWQGCAAVAMCSLKLPRSLSTPFSPAVGLIQPYTQFFPAGEVVLSWTWPIHLGQRIWMRGTETPLTHASSWRGYYVCTFTSLRKWELLLPEQSSTALILCA